ncbi:fungal-specific transcription factor domain-containing protein [Penicillium angulare]|uniref:fungal-specific transcription factor domain-containing protein n=1 Tax=Penicillium angulare TaxID=116970 RepID=UPI00253FFCC1|nr:fungal-specific transcription factor domain-containing protein [Penicillium angulare]KAJ5280028.1 fungal-specific transcription factor domain-containing protein [Penicillium angulare]
MGTFRLLVHAAYLVGRVIQLVSDHHTGQQSIARRQKQLYCTIDALANVLEVERQITIVSVSVARSTLNSAVFVLYSFGEPGNDEFGDIYDPNHPISKSAHACVKLTNIYISGDLTSAQSVSPFLLSWGFHVFRYFYNRYNIDGHQESFELLEIMRKGLEALGNKWKLAEVYGVLLNGSQEETINK